MSPDFDSMTTPELRAYAREHFSSISRIRQRQRLIDAMRYQVAKMALRSALEKPQTN